MSYSSPIFLFLFLPLSLAGYLLMPGLAARNVFLLLASLAFYTWGEGVYALLLLLSIAVNHGLGLWVERARGGRSAKVALVLTVAANIGLLGAFKYTGFLVDNLNPLLGWLALPQLTRPALHLPIGLSFFTFQAMSYVFDIYLGRSEAQKNPLHTALFIACFPQLLLGPIVRYRDIAAELTRRPVSAEDFALGANRFTIGLGKKVLIADTLALGVDRVFALPFAELTPALAWLGAVGFTLQLYFDYSSYSDMGIGLGRVFGFHFRENFNYPLIARSRSDFFRRWNISLFTWMRDYVFFPLCGRHCPLWRVQLNVLIMFFLVGLWHGPRWQFVIWGTANGLLIVVEQVWLRRWLLALWRPLQHLYMLAWTVTSLILLRCVSLEQAESMIEAMFGFVSGAGQPGAGQLGAGQLGAGQLGAGQIGVGTLMSGEFALVLVLAALGSVPFYPFLTDTLRRRIDPWLAARPVSIGALVLVPSLLWHGGLLAVSAMAVAARTYTPFVYFQF